MSTCTSSGRPRVLSEEIEYLLNESLCHSFPDLGNIADFFPVLGANLEKYGDDYASPSVVMVCNYLRAQDPYLFCKRGTEDIAKVIMNNFRNSEMVQQVSLRSGYLVSFKLSWEWMAKRIQNMLNDGIYTWAPIYGGLRRAIVEFPTWDMDSNMHADVFRSRYIRDMLVRMFEYSRVDVSLNVNHGSSRKRVFDENMVQKFFIVEQGEFKERGKHGHPLFVGRAGGRGCSMNVDIDLRRLWSSIMEEHADLILYITPVRLRGYVEKCITAAKDVKWVKDDGKCQISCCAYQTSINEKGKLACLLDEFRNYSEAGSLVEIGKAAGYTCTAESFFESALRYTYLKTPRRVDVSFSLDEMLDVKGNTLVYLLNIQAFIRSIIETPRRGTFKLTKALVAKERELGLHIVRFTDVIEEACLRVSAHMVCEYLYDLCKKFMSCYGEHCAPNRASLGVRRPLRGLEEFLSSKEGKLATVNCFIPWPVSKARCENPRFEMFSMFVTIFSDFQEGNLCGHIRVSDAYGIVPDGWVTLFADEIGHVCYYKRCWCDPSRIKNDSFIWFGNPSSRHAVAFSSSIEIHMDLTITTQKEKDCKDACYEIYIESEQKLSFWEEQNKTKCDTLSYESNDGILQIHYILLRDAVDTTMEFRFESHVPNLIGFKVHGHVFAYYGDGVLDEKHRCMQMFYEAVIFQTDGAYVLAGEKLQLQRSVLSVPANGCLMIKAFLKDVKSGEVIVDTTHEYRAIPTGISEWKMPVPAKNGKNGGKGEKGEKGTFYFTVNWSRGPGIIS
ncbi:arginine--tRNA ligase, chloroplastic/mitochondrial [Tanacetum coccineum]